MIKMLKSTYSKGRQKNGLPESITVVIEEIDQEAFNDLNTFIDKHLSKTYKKKEKEKRIG